MANLIELFSVSSNRVPRWAVGAVLLLAVLASGTVSPLVSAQNCNNYTVTFLGATFDGTNTTFRYRVCSNGNPAISHWVMGLPGGCSTCADVVSAGRVGSSSVTWSCGTDPTTGVFGVKFDFGFTSVGQCEEFWITLRGYWPTGYTTAAVKAGSGNCFYQVEGPACPPPGQPGLVLEKKTNGVDADSPPGPVVVVGSTVTWTYEVTNTGNVTLTEIVVTDDQVGSIGTISTLAPGASATLTKAGVAVAGQYANVGKAETTYNGQTVSDTDPSHYFGAAPGLVLEKKTNGVDADSPPGPVVVVGSTVTWTYEVTNTGNVTLTEIVVTDDQVGSIGTISTLAPGASATLTKAGVAVAGQYANVGKAETTYNGQTVSDTDPSHYFGAAPGLVLEKKTNGVDADSPTGPVVVVGSTVTWTYEVTNTGNVTLTEIVVTDDQVGSIGTIPTLAVGASATLTKTGVAVAGQYANVGKAETTYNGQAVSDTDPSHYFGADPSIDLVKTGTLNLGPNGQADAGDTISYTFAVTNTGNVTLTNVTVADPKVTVVGGPIASLAAGATDTTTFTGTYVLTQADIDAGTFTNTATATGTPPSGPNVSDSDSDTQTLVGVPSIDIEKHTNGVDADSPTGPVVVVGSTVTWTYEVTNTGNVTLTEIVVTDDQVGSIGTISTLAPGASATLTKTGVAVAGQYGNVGKAETTYNGQTVSDTDPSHYLGVDGHLAITPGSATNEVGDPHTFLITAYAQGASPIGWSLVYTVTPTPTSESLSTPTVAPDGMSATWSLTINSAVPGTFVAIPTVTMTFPGGTEVVRTTDGLGGSTVPAQKTYLQGRISLSPAAATNEVGDPHTLIAAVETTSDGLTWIPMSGVQVAFSIIGGTASFVGGVNTSITNGAGQAAAQIVSATPGTVLVQAAADLFGDGTFIATTGTAGNGGNAQKTYVDARISVTPLGSVNPVGTNHAVTALVEVNTGAGWVPAPNGTPVMFTLLNNTAGATFVTASTTSTTGGQASVTVFSSNPGGVAIRATADVTVAGLVVRRATGSGGLNGSDAVKNWVRSNEPPTADGLSLVTCRNTPLAFSLRGSDPDVNLASPDQHPLAFAIIGAPTFGAVSGDLSAVTYSAPHSASVEVVYTPQLDFLGTDFVTYTVTDPTGTFAVGAIRITVVDCGGEIAGGAGALGPRIVINEIAWGGTAADPNHEWIELYSSLGEPIDLTGWTLRWRRKQPATVLEEYVKVVELRGAIDAFGFYLMERRTDDVVADIEADLIYEETGPIVITEIAWGGTAASRDDQWIELTNVTENAVDLTGWTLRWRLTQPTTPEEQAWKVVQLRGTVTAYGTYLLERGSDDAVRGVPADLIYAVALDPRGEVLELLDPAGNVVDTANAERMGRSGWASGYGLGGVHPYASMERVNPFVRDAEHNWRGNEGVLTHGLDRDGVPLVATPRAVNEQFLLWAYPEVNPAELPSDLAYLPFTLELSDRGEILELVDRAGNVVDTANADNPDRDGWAVGYGLHGALLHATMERVDPSLPDLDTSWDANEYIVINGLDTDEACLVATARTTNEPVVMRSAAEQASQAIGRGQILTVVVVAPPLCDAVRCLPHAVITRADPAFADQVMVVGDSGARVVWGEPVERTDNFRFLVDTTSLEVGSYRVWISLGSSRLHVISFEVVEEAVARSR
ncbi:MAG: hypothetical protein BIP78_0821 [Candidatus Bipolaricaulis sibiricus]|uniref:Uncharacterized protein n=1 Tax=Bipolaricaulis sibiricus TaxID=2501609 RepID=A0A410FU18_BIPS1|nr:MAG: hypothetical protein BIP78_0821 [Candidatus Bipolaricaulis sibiricus]